MVACLRSSKIRLIKLTSFSRKSKNPALNSQMFLSEGWRGLMDFLRSSRHRSNGVHGHRSLKVTVKCTGLIHRKVTIPTWKPPAAPETPTRSSPAKYGICTLHVPARPPRPVTSTARDSTSSFPQPVLDRGGSLLPRRICNASVGPTRKRRNGV